MKDKLYNVEDDYFCPKCGYPATDRENCPTCGECECMCQCDDDGGEK